MSELFCVSGCENPQRSGDVIFIHGLAGDAWGTWHYQDRRDRSDRDFWLTWLQNDLTHKGIDVGVWTFGYDAARFQFSGSAMPRFDQASNLLEFLQVREIGERPVVFVTHSMGGLLVKEMLRTAQNFRMQTLMEQTKGIVFLSTPHTGSHLAKLIDHFSILVRPTVNVEELKAHVPALRSLNEWYRQNVQSLAIDTKVFYETQPTAGILVVDEDSANPGIVNVNPVAIAKDHNQIAKPSSKEDLVYLSVKQFIEKHIKPRPQLPSGDTIVLQRPTFVQSENPHYPL